MIRAFCKEKTESTAQRKRSKTTFVASQIYLSLEEGTKIELYSPAMEDLGQPVQAGRRKE